MKTKMMDYLIMNKETLMSKVTSEQTFKGYLILEHENKSLCYCLKECVLVPVLNNTADNKCTVLGVINNLASSECEIEEITKSVAYANVLHRYSNIINKIDNRRKELANLEKRIKIAESKLQTLLKFFMPVMPRHQGESYAKILKDVISKLI